MKSHFVFVLMPFDKQFDDIYQLGIKAACKDLNVYCERIDEQIFTESILDRIYNQINKADIIIADMTGRNPNVFYETGFSHALQKKVILLTQNVEDIPFDLKHYSHIIYGSSIVKLKEELTKRIDWFIRNPSENETPNLEGLEYYFNGIKLENDLVIDFNRFSTKYRLRHQTANYSLPFQLDLYNPYNKLISVHQQIGIITSQRFFQNDNGHIKTIKLPERKCLHISNRSYFEMYPFTWDFIHFEFAGGWNLDDFEEKFILRIYGAISLKEISFTIKYKGH